MLCSLLKKEFEYLFFTVFPFCYCHQNIDLSPLDNNQTFTNMLLQDQVRVLAAVRLYMYLPVGFVIFMYLNFPSCTWVRIIASNSKHWGMHP